MRINSNYQWTFRTITVLTILYSVLIQIPFVRLRFQDLLQNKINQPMQAPLGTACPSSPGVEQLNQYGSY